MFDVGFWELALLGLILLLVVGPERLPRFARTAGLWIGRGRRMLGSMKAEIDREIKAQELKEILDKQARSNPLESILEDPVDQPTRQASTTEATSARPGAGGKPESDAGLS
ncbi:MAG: Sec-independent protein translocase protein TatB [Candidatus Thiosymbion ectosymbiont of Robbea hypermnestra]|nr:Sec-independent protein translocase protein TatB [Candidatus Thiosymbion ectosymbiont of Robbea hypermnestra]